VRQPIERRAPSNETTNAGWHGRGQCALTEMVGRQAAVTTRIRSNKPIANVNTNASPKLNALSRRRVAPW
jgi:hypothetical protein